jgi:hypothetical protein
MAEFPHQTYYPACKVRLIVRFDEFSDEPSAVPPKKPATMRKGQKDKGQVLDYIIDPDAPEGTKRYRLAGRGQTEAQEASKDNLTHVIEGIIPVSATLEKNTYKEADTLELSLSYLDLPFDPRTVRSCAVEFYLGTIDGDTWRESMRLQVIADLPDESEYGTNRQFKGWVDDWRVNWGNEEAATVELSCRDNTALFIDQDAPPQIKVDPKVGIDEAIAKYLSCFPQYEGIAVEYRPINEDAPALKDVMQRSSQRNGGVGPGKDKMSVWDFIIDITGMVGCVAFIDGETVVIQKPRTLYADGFSRLEDPWRGRVADNIPMNNRTMIYGRNLTEFSVSRRYNEKAPRNIEVRCYLPERKKTIVVRFPGVKSRVQPGESADNTITVFRVSGVQTKEALQVIAQGIYEDISRQEIEVSMKTPNIASFGGDNTEPDLLYLQAGDPIEVYFAKDDSGDPVTLPATQSQVEDALLTSDKTFDYLQSLGYDPDIASAYAEAYTNAGYQTAFRTFKVTYDWTDEDGVTISIDAINYIEVRYDKALPDGLEPEPTAE